MAEWWTHVSRLMKMEKIESTVWHFLFFETLKKGEDVVTVLSNFFFLYPFYVVHTIHRLIKIKKFESTVLHILFFWTPKKGEGAVTVLSNFFILYPFYVVHTLTPSDKNKKV